MDSAEIHKRKMWAAMSVVGIGSMFVLAGVLVIAQYVLCQDSTIQPCKISITIGIGMILTCMAAIALYAIYAKLTTDIEDCMNEEEADGEVAEIPSRKEG